MRTAALVTITTLLATPAVANPGESPQAAGQQFEGVFWSLLIKTMRTSTAEGGLFAGDQSDTFGGLFDLFMSQHLAGSGALGIQEMVESWLATSQQAETGNKGP